MGIFKKILKWIGWFFLAVLLYVVACILHGTATDYAPHGVSKVDIEKPDQDTVIGDSILSFITWNVGYGGLGAKSDFFYDNGGFLTDLGQMVRSPRNLVDEYIAGANGFLQAKKDNTDFFFLQEVDVNSNRSYHINQYEGYQKILDGYSSTFALNFDVVRVPIPVMQPWNVIGKAYSGLGTFSKYTPSEANRHQLPGEHEWPNRIFQLDRCAAIHRFPLKNGKDLIAVNIHNSAYDKTGVMKKEQVAYLRDIFVKEYEKGNYVVAGGDWNECPPGFSDEKFNNGKRVTGLGISADFFPQGWVWAHDPDVPTNRSLVSKFEKGKSDVSLIDYFLVSPNVEVRDVKGINSDFAYSDHQPVKLEVRLK